MLLAMFDYIYNHRPLPKSDLPPDAEFQSKDFDCLLEHYVITADGRLLRCRSIAEELVELTGATDTEHHGDIRFHGSGPRGERYEFVARFTHGRLEWVKRDREAERAWGDRIRKSRF
jgi:hypothetical protein